MQESSYSAATRHTASVSEHRCLYTHDIRRKAKRWQDGILKFHAFNKRVMCYDLLQNFVGDAHWQDANCDRLQDGEELTLDTTGIIVQVGEILRETRTNLSEMWTKKPRTTPTAHTGAQTRPGVTLEVLRSSASRSPLRFQLQRPHASKSLRKSPFEQRQAAETGQNIHASASRKRQRRDDEHVPLNQILGHTLRSGLRASTQISAAFTSRNSARSRANVADDEDQQHAHDCVDLRPSLTDVLPDEPATQPRKRRAVVSGRHPDSTATGDHQRSYLMPMGGEVVSPRTPQVIAKDPAPNFDLLTRTNESSLERAAPRTGRPLCEKNTTIVLDSDSCQGNNKFPPNSKKALRLGTFTTRKKLVCQTVVGNLDQFPIAKDLLETGARAFITRLGNGVAPDRSKFDSNGWQIGVMDTSERGDAEQSSKSRRNSRLAESRLTATDKLEKIDHPNSTLSRLAAKVTILSEASKMRPQSDTSPALESNGAKEAQSVQHSAGHEKVIPNEEHKMDQLSAGSGKMSASLQPKSVEPAESVVTMTTPRAPNTCVNRPPLNRIIDEPQSDSERGPWSREAWDLFG